MTKCRHEESRGLECCPGHCPRVIFIADWEALVTTCSYRSDYRSGKELLKPNLPEEEPQID